MTDPLEFLYRAQAVQTQMGLVSARAQSAADAGDLEGVHAARREAEFLHEQMVGIRQEQLAAMMPKPRPAPWWRRLFARTSRGHGRNMDGDTTSGPGS